MNRRRFLGAAFAGGSVFLPGCTSFLGGVDLNTGDERLPGIPGSDRTVWYHNSEGKLYLEPSKQELVLPRDSLNIKLRNETDLAYNTNYYGWELHKLRDGEWTHIHPELTPAPLQRLEPEGSHTWSLTIDNSRIGDEDWNTPEGMKELHISGVEGGTHAFSVDGWFEGESQENTVALAAVINLRGGELDPEPNPSRYNRLERENGTLVVYLPDSESSEKAVMTFTRLPGDSMSGEGDVGELIDEFVVGSDGLVNSLPFLFRQEGVEEVVVVTGEHVLSETKRSMMFAGASSRKDGVSPTTLHYLFRYRDRTFRMDYKQDDELVYSDRVEYNRSQDPDS